MLAAVTAIDGSGAQVHRTFLGPNGKADIETPRALMPGGVPDGAAVRLWPAKDGHLGIAEGIETSLAAMKRFRVPVWAALNSRLLEKWEPPEGITKVTIFGDCDAKYGGQAAAYRLAHKLAAWHKIQTEVMIPEQFGIDWADVA